MKRMEGGDRLALGDFLARYGPMIRRRVRGKLRASVRRLYDSQDILSTVSRRLDAYVMSGRFQARSEDEFWGLVFKVAHNSVTEKARIVESLRTREGEDSEFAVWMLGRLTAPPLGDESIGESLELDDLLDILKNDEDRTITRMWADGASHAQIGVHMGMAGGTVRQRLHRIRETLQDVLAERRS